jgi:hypothetical protein
MGTYWFIVNATRQLLRFRPKTNQLSSRGQQQGSRAGSREEETKRPPFSNSLEIPHLRRITII